MSTRSDKPPVLLLVNPTSGHGTARQLARQMQRALEGIAAEIETFESRGPGDITERAGAVRDASTVLLVVGGDGTVREVIDGLSVAAPVAFLPSGSANVLATELGLPRTPQGVARLITQGNRRLLDTGSIANSDSQQRGDGPPVDHTFFLMVGAGIDGRIVRRVHAHRHGGTLGKLRYVRPIIDELVTYRTVDHWVELDSGTRCGPFAEVIVANARSYGGFWKLPAQIVMGDGWLDVLGFRAAGRTALFWHAIRGIGNCLTPGATLFHARVRNVRITADSASPLQADGDPCGACPCEIRIRPASIRLLVP
ncbi:MAG: diacylglycerol kinase family protein [Pirellulales bacterium]